MTLVELQERVRDIIARGKAHSALRRSLGLCCEYQCDEPLAGADFAFGDDYCVKHATELNLEVCDA